MKFFLTRRVVIESMMSTGVYLLVGASKIGKSFLVAQIAYHVSTGKELWGNVAHDGTVLYLALEDDKKRLQESMARMFGVEDTDRLHFATEAGLVGQGLDKQLDNFIRNQRPFWICGRRYYGDRKKGVPALLPWSLPEEITPRSCCTWKRIRRYWPGNRIMQKRSCGKILLTLFLKKSSAL